MDSCQPDEEDTEIDAEIQKELNALNVEDLEDTSSSDEDVIGEESVEVTDDEVPECISEFIQRLQSRTDNIQEDISECDALLSKVVEVTQEEKDDFFYQSRELKEYAFQIGEDPEELRDRVIQELAAEDEEDTEMPALEGPGVQVIALEGPLFEGIVGTDGSPVLALEGPPTVSSTEGKVISLAEPRSVEVFDEPIQRLQEIANKTVRVFEERFNLQLKEYREDYEENERARVKREKFADEDRARRRRQNSEEQQKLAEKRMVEQSKIQEEMEKQNKILQRYLDQYEKDIKILDAKTKQEKLAFLEERLEQQKKLAEKMADSALKIQSVYRSYRARKPYLKKIKQIKENVNKQMTDKRQMEIAVEKKQEEQRKKREREDRRRREEEERLRAEEELKKKKDEEERKREQEMQERQERERLEAEKDEEKRKDEEMKKKEQREMEEKANEILMKIMKEKKVEKERMLTENRRGGNMLEKNTAVKMENAVKVNIVMSEDLNDSHDGREVKGSGMPIEATRTEFLVDTKMNDNSNLFSQSNKDPISGNQKDEVLNVEINKCDPSAGKMRSTQIAGTGEDSSTLPTHSHLGKETKGRDRICGQSVEGRSSHKNQEELEAKTEVKNKQNYSQKSRTTTSEHLATSVKTDNSNGALMNNSMGSDAGRMVSHEKESDDANSNFEEVMVQSQEKSMKKVVSNSGAMKKSIKIDQSKSETESNRDGSVDGDGTKERVRESKRSAEDNGKKDVQSKLIQDEKPDHDRGEGINRYEGEIDGTSKLKDNYTDTDGEDLIKIESSLSEELENARQRWMESSTSYSMHLIKAKDCLRILERAKRKHLRKPSALKKLAAISEEKLLEASSVVKTLAEVTTVELVDLPGCTLETLRQCPRLSAVRCQSSDIQSLEGLDNSPDVTFLDLKGNLLSSINCRDLRNLVFLDLSKNDLTTIHGLEGCLSLKWLNLSGNKISRLNGLEYLLSLSHLDVSDNQLINCQSLSSLVHLVSLDLSRNHLSNVSYLDSCPLLQRLQLTNNSISEPPLLSDHVMLIELLLDNNSLISMETLQTSWLPRLEHLSLSQNSLSIVPVLEFAFRLKKLNVSNNYITDLHSLSSGLSKLPYLESLSINDNPVTEELNYKKEILKLSPSLIFLNEEQLEPAVSSCRLSKFEEMCHSQMEVDQSVKKRLSAVLSSICADSHRLQNEAATWCAYLEYTLKMSIDHRYMHEHGELSPLTLTSDDIQRMILDPIPGKVLDTRRGISLTDSENLTSLIPLIDDAVKGLMDEREGVSDKYNRKQLGKISLHGHRSNLKIERSQDIEGDSQDIEGDSQDIEGDSQDIEGDSQDIEGDSQDIKGDSQDIEGDSQDIEGDSTSRKEVNKLGKDRTHEIGEVVDCESRRSSAATKIQSAWRGHAVRRDIKIHSERYLAALTIQSVFKGYIVRKRFRKAMASLRVEKSKQEEDEFYLNEDVDLDFLEFSEENLEKGWLPPETPQVAMAHPCLPPKYPLRENSPHHRPLSSVSLTSSLSTGKFAPHPPREAWKGISTPQSPQKNHSSFPHDMNMLSSKPPLPPVTPSTQRGESSMGTTARTVRSKKEQQLSEEWGFKDDTTAELMLKRAKKMNSRNKKKQLDPVKKYQMMRKIQASQTGRTVQAQTKRGIQRKEYFKAREEAAEQKVNEVKDRTFEWVNAQVQHYDQSKSAIDSPHNRRGRHSSSEPNLPRMSPDVLQGRVQLTASPSLDLESVASSSIHGLPNRVRSNSFSSPDGDSDQFPPLKANSAPTDHVRQRQLSISNHTGIVKGKYQAWERSPQTTKKR